MDSQDRRSTPRGQDRRQELHEETTPTDLLELAESRDLSEQDLEIPAFPKDNVLELMPVDIAQTAEPSQEQDVQIFTFMGASGGVGTTSLATQIAYELATRNKSTAQFARPRNSKVCLIDLDFETGACAHHLDTHPNMTTADLCGDAGRIDTAYTSALVNSHSSGISLLATGGLPGGLQSINPHAVLALLDAASKLYRYVVVDLPRQHHAWTLPVIGGSDFTGLTFEMTVPSIHLAKNQLNWVQSQLGEAGMLEPIANKYERRSLNNALRISDAEKALQRSVWSTVCVDSDSAREAVNCGSPVGQVRPNSRLAKDSRKLVDRLVQLNTITRETQSASSAA